MAQKLTVTYPDGTRALKEIDLEVPSESVVLILGRSGSGKSTLGKTIAGIIPHLEKAKVTGTLEVDHIDPRETPIEDLTEHVAYLAQSPYEQVIFTFAKDEIELITTIRRSTNIKYVEDLAKMLNIEHIINRRTNELSGGELQKLLILCILLTGSKIIILDEPLAHLDPASCREFLKVIKMLKKEKRTVILIEHRFEELTPLIDDNVIDLVILIDNGKKVLECESSTLINYVDILYKCGIRIPVNIILYRCLNLRASSFSDVEVFSSIASSIHNFDNVDDVSVDSNIILQVEHLYAGYQRMLKGFSKSVLWVLKDVSLVVHEGEIVCVAGPNGGGKSTLLLAVIGEVPYTKGLVKICNVDIRKIRRGIAGLVMYIPQNPDLVLVHETVKKEVEVRARFRARSRLELDRIVNSILRELDLIDLAHRNPQSLSRGQRFRVAIAAAIAAEPKLLLLDEPTVGQDQHCIELLGELVRKYVRENKAGAVIVTHDVNFILNYSDTLAVMKEGRILKVGKTLDVVRDRDLMLSCNIVLPRYVETMFEFNISARPRTLVATVCS